MPQTNETSWIYISVIFMFLMFLMLLHINIMLTFTSHLSNSVNSDLNLHSLSMLS